MQRLPGRLARPVARALFLLVLPAAGLTLSNISPAAAQGVTTGAMAGLVVDAQQKPVTGASVIVCSLPICSN